MGLGDEEQDHTSGEKGLSEDVIKRVTLPFLRGYYKFRSDLMESDLEAGNLLESCYDKTTPEGYMIDGYITFRQRTGGAFIATFEATSADKKDELYYKILYPLIIWDGLAVSSILLTCLLTLSYALKWFDFKTVGLMLLILGSFFLLSLLTLLLRFFVLVVFKGADRYHYIYAIEQFKKYTANEKWIIFGEEVFSSSDDPYFMELRDQCVKGGFGLVRIAKDLQITKILTPARIYLTGGTGILNVVMNNEFTKTISKAPFLPNLKRYFSSRFRTVEQRFNYLKFRRSYLPQVFVVALNFILISSIFWKEFKDPEMVYETDASYEEKLMQRKFVAKNNADTILDSLELQSIQTIDTSVENYLDLPMEERPNYILKQRKPNSVTFDTFTPSTTIAHETRNYGIYLLTDGKVTVRVGCQRIASSKVQYLVQESIHADSSSAFRRASTLQQRDVAANVFWTGCTNVQRDSYAVFLDMFFDTLYVAQIQANISKRLLESKGLVGNVKLRPIKVTE